MLRHVEFRIGFSQYNLAMSEATVLLMGSARISTEASLEFFKNGFA